MSILELDWFKEVLALLTGSLIKAIRSSVTFSSFHYSLFHGFAHTVSQIMKLSC